MSRLSRYTPVGLTLALALMCVVWEVVRLPAHGLMLEKFSFEVPLGPPALDGSVYFWSGDNAHPVPPWLTNRMSARWTGFIDAPRTGMYSFVLSTDDGGSLFVDGRLLVQITDVHPGQAQSVRLKLHQGLHPLRIDYDQVEGGAGMKLEWFVPTNWGRQVMVPVAKLFPTKPPPVGWPDRSLRLAPWLLVLLAVALARRDRIAEGSRRLGTDAQYRSRFVAGGLILLLAAGVRFYDLTAAGETCDEGGYALEGGIYADNIAAGIFDPEQWRENQAHPNVGKLVYGFTHFVFGDAPGTPNVGAAVLSSLTVLITFLAALRLFGLATAISSGIILALFPSVIAHAKISSLECPATFFFVLAMYLLLRALHQEKGRNASYGWMSLVTGVAIAAKFTNGFLLPIIIVGVLINNWKSIRTTGRLNLPWTLLGFPFTPFLVVFATWPWLWANTVDHLSETLHIFGYVPPDWFLGEYGAPPKIYFAAAFAAVTPVGLYLPFLIGAAQIFRRQPGASFQPFPEGCCVGPRTWWLFLLSWFIAPFGWSFVSFRQDGIRYVYNAFPPFAIIAGAGLVILGRFLGRLASERGWVPVSRAAVPILASAIGVYLAVSDALIHPYYLDYFNEAVGGTKHVFEKRIFETGWWGEGLDKTVPYVNAHAKPSATYEIRGAFDHTLQDLRDDLRRVQSESGGDFIISTDISPGMDTPLGYDEVMSVQAGHVPIVELYERHGLQR